MICPMELNKTILVITFIIAVIVAFHVGGLMLALIAAIFCSYVFESK